MRASAKCLTGFLVCLFLVRRQSLSVGVCAVDDAIVDKYFHIRLLFRRRIELSDCRCRAKVTKMHNFLSITCFLSPFNDAIINGRDIGKAAFFAFGDKEKAVNGHCIEQLNYK